MFDEADANIELICQALKFMIRETIRMKDIPDNYLFYILM